MQNGTAITFGYDPATDYSKLIAQAVKGGDMARAAIYEAQRNEKIAAEGRAERQTNTYAGYLPGAAPANTGWQNPYQAELDKALGRLQDTSAFSKQYLQQADRTMQDTIGQYSTMTGGLPSTQAVAAASQAADYQKSQLAGLLAEKDAQNASLLLSAGSQAQSEYQMRISEALTRWTSLGYADNAVAQILGVAVGTPTTDRSYQNWQMGQQEKADAYTQAMTLLQTGNMPSADLLAAAGLNAQDAQALLAAATKTIYQNTDDIKYLGKERFNLAEKYQEGGWNAISGYINYYCSPQGGGYDREELTNWIYDNYTAPETESPPTPQPDQGLSAERTTK